MNVSIPQMIIGIVSMFLALLIVRVIEPFYAMIFALTWDNAMVEIVAKLMVFLVVGFVFYVIIYGMIMGRAPNVLNLNKKNGGLE